MGLELVYWAVMVAVMGFRLGAGIAGDRESLI